MSKTPIKIGIAGTHSTGKTTFLGELETLLSAAGLTVGRVNDLARRARDLGFPILTEHTIESTLWIMAECMKQEAELSLSSDVILVDRPVPDALGYLNAALQISGRRLPNQRIGQLRAIAEAHTRDYDFMIVTVLDRSVPLGPGRDKNSNFRELAAEKIDELMSELVPNAPRLSPSNREEMLRAVNSFISGKRAAE
jgi:hypothetical protein